MTEDNEYYVGIIRQYRDTLDEKYYEEAYKELYEQSVFCATSMVDSLSGNQFNHLDPEEIAQEFWLLVLMHKIDVYNLYTDIFKVFYNIILYNSREKRGGKVTFTEPDQIDSLEGSLPTPEFITQLRQSKDIIDEYLDEVPDIKKAVIHLAIKEEYNTNEISEVLGISVSYINDILRQARVKLRSKLNGNR